MLTRDEKIIMVDQVKKVEKYENGLQSPIERLLYFVGTQSAAQ